MVQRGFDSGRGRHHDEAAETRQERGTSDWKGLSLHPCRQQSHAPVHAAAGCIRRVVKTPSHLPGGCSHRPITFITAVSYLLGQPRRGDGGEYGGRLEEGRPAVGGLFQS